MNVTMSRRLTLALVACAAAAPTALAGPVFDPGGAETLRAAAAPIVTELPARPIASLDDLRAIPVGAMPVAVAGSRGFDWGDAGAGFGAAAALALLGGGSVLAARRVRQTRHPAT